MVEVTGINVILAPGVYWLNVEPVGNGTGHSLNTTTTGANCVGMPCGNDGNSFFNPGGPSKLDFSMGVIGTVVPEPATAALLGVGISGLFFIRRRPRTK